LIGSRPSEACCTTLPSTRTSRPTWMSSRGSIHLQHPSDTPANRCPPRTCPVPASPTWSDKCSQDTQSRSSLRSIGLYRRHRSP
jgi:hypothetical protein